jgi:hypothetical protein
MFRALVNTNEYSGWQLVFNANVPENAHAFTGLMNVRYSVHK